MNDVCIYYRPVFRRVSTVYAKSTRVWALLRAYEISLREENQSEVRLSRQPDPACPRCGSFKSPSVLLSGTFFVFSAAISRFFALLRRGLEVACICFAAERPHMISLHVTAIQLLAIFF